MTRSYLAWWSAMPTTAGSAQALNSRQGDSPRRWHGRWHRIAIAAIVEQAQVLADVGQDDSLTCGVAVNANIRGGIRIFKTGDVGSPLGGFDLPPLCSEPLGHCCIRGYRVEAATLLA